MGDIGARDVSIIVDPDRLAEISRKVSIMTYFDTDIRHFRPIDHLSEFEKKFPEQMRLFQLVGMHPRKNEILIDPYTKEPASESFANVGEHCIAVAYCASKIAGVMCEAGLISDRDFYWVCERALVHDLNKPFEIMRKNAKGAGLAEDVYSISAYENLKPLLIEAGISESLAEYLTKAGSETGHNSLKDFIVVGPNGYQGLVHGKTAEKIVHLADDMTFTNNPRDGQASITCFLTAWERMLASQFIEKYPFLWKEGIGIDQKGSIATVADVNTLESGLKLAGSYAELQVRVANSIARELQLLIDPFNAEAPENFIKRIVNDNLK